MTMSAALCHLLAAFLALVLAQSVDCELDRWAKLNRGGSYISLDHNQKALYAVTTTSGLQVLKSDIGVETVASGVIDVGVNDDLEVWMVMTGGGMAYRSGISSSNLVGTGTQGVGGLGTGIVTGRRGLTFCHNSGGQIFERYGFESQAYGTTWGIVSGAGIIRVSCGLKVCLCVTHGNHLYTTRMLPSGLSPAFPSSWTRLPHEAIDVSVKEAKSLWRIDPDGKVWQAVDVLDSNLIKLAWERRVYDATTKLTAISASKKIQFGVAEDKYLRVLTGCPIFDFEENSLSKWNKTGTAFLVQPVVSQESHYEFPSGKVGDRLIDTLSSRKHNGMEESAADSTQGNSVTGTLTSPLFLIQTDMLHFVIGGGSYPQNYVALIVDGTEVLRTSGQSKTETSASGKVRSGRYYWDVSTYKGKCAAIKIYDMGTDAYGHTIFDDLRASPPCFSNMKVVFENWEHSGEGISGSIMAYKITLIGFYTSKKRPLSINVDLPTAKNESYVYIETIDVKSMKCFNAFKHSQKMSSSSVFSTRWHSMKYEVTDYVLTRITFLLYLRVYDHDNLRGADWQSTKMSISVNYADEYVQHVERDIIVKVVGNETAKLVLNETFLANNSYFVGENISYHVELKHDYKLSMQRAYNVRIQLLLPPYLNVIHVKGMRKMYGDAFLTPLPSQNEVYIPELLLDDNRTLEFIMQFSVNPYWKTDAKLQGEFIVNSVAYCPHRNCTRSASTGIAVVQMLENKLYQFSVSKKNSTKLIQGNAFTRIQADNGLFLIICGAAAPARTLRRCFYGNGTGQTWFRYSSTLERVLFYDPKAKEVYGETQDRKKVKLFGDRFDSNLFLTDDEWKTVSSNAAFLKPLETDTHGGTLAETALHYRWCCGG